MGFLTPFKVVTIVGTMDEYIYTPGDGVVIRGEPEPGKLYTRKATFNRVIITIPAREQRRVKYWMAKINPKDKDPRFLRHPRARGQREGLHQPIRG